MWRQHYPLKEGDVLLKTMFFSNVSLCSPCPLFCHGWSGADALGGRSPPLRRLSSAAQLSPWRWLDEEGPCRGGLVGAQCLAGALLGEKWKGLAGGGVGCGVFGWWLVCFGWRFCGIWWVYGMFGVFWWCFFLGTWSWNEGPRAVQAVQFSFLFLIYCSRTCLLLGWVPSPTGGILEIVTWPEGFALPMEGERGASLHVLLDHLIEPRNQHGTKPVVACGPAALNNTRKRAWKRTVNRLQRDGFAFYHGKCLTLNSHNPTFQFSAVPKVSSEKSRRPNLKYFCWNTGGLTAQIYDQLMIWLTRQGIDVALLQGTRWPKDLHWTSHGYTAIHSADAQPKGHAGLLTLISTRVCSSDAVSFADIIPGRLVHVKCQLKHNTVDLVNLYQHPTNSTDSRKDPITARADVWQALDKLLQSLPIRNVAVVGGDFNTELHVSGVHAPPKVPDAIVFRDIIDKFSLSHTRSHDALPSYISPSGYESRIDFVFLRKIQMNALAHQGCCLEHFVVSAARASPDHLPLVGTIPLGWRPWLHRGNDPVRFTKAQQGQMHHSWMQGDAVWQNFQPKLEAKLKSLGDPKTALTDLQHWAAHTFTTKAVPPRKRIQAPWTHHGLQTDFVTLWGIHKQLRSVVVRDLKTAFGAWQLFRQYHVMHRCAKTKGRELRKARVQVYLDQASAAASAHDMRLLYLTIRALSPKQPFAPIRLRCPSKGALTAAEEAIVIRDHFADVFFDARDVQPGPQERLDQMPFSLPQLEQALANTPATKAVMPNTLSPILVKVGASYISNWLYKHLCHWWLEGPVFIPQGWKDAFLTLVPKRAVRSPKDLRPIALQNCVGKAVMGLIASLILSDSCTSLIQLPLFAYLQARGTQEALVFVGAHLRRVRLLCEQARMNIWAHKAKRSVPSLVGGLLCSLDLSAAFDKVPRTHIMTGLKLAQVRPDLLKLVAEWLQNSTYWFKHRGMQHQLFTSHGIRQGCKASPILWNCFVLAFCHHVAQHLSWEWVQRHLVCYADDFVVYFALSEGVQLEQALRELGVFFDCLDSFGLTVNYNKTVAMVRLAGKAASATLKRMQVQHHGKAGLHVPRSCGGPTWIPWVTQHTYLGAIISYHSFEQLTLQHRLKVGRIAFNRLRRWFCGRSGLNLCQRLQMWTICIRSSYTYASFAFGYTRACLLTFARACIIDLRRLARSPVHLTCWSLCQTEVSWPHTMFERSLDQQLREPVCDAGDFATGWLCIWFWFSFTFYFDHDHFSTWDSCRCPCWSTCMPLLRCTVSHSPCTKIASY